MDDWLACVTRRETHVAIMGLGYVGLPLALMFVDAGFRVTGFDVDSAKVAALNAGRSYIQRISPQQIKAAVDKSFRATTDMAELHACDAILLCVPTPLHADHTPDMSFVTGTIDALVPHTRAGQLIVLESTTYPGTTEELLAPALNAGPTPVLRNDDSDLNALAGLMVAFSPEREDPGNTTTPRRTIPKVIGGLDSRASRAASALYATIFDRTILMSSPSAAEMTKLLENIYRGVNIALVNELKQLCLTMGLDVWEIIDAAATKPFGFQPFYPGPGIGGHCIPVDPFYLSWRARQFGHETRFIQLAGEVNEAMPAFVVRTTAAALEQQGKTLNGARVLVLGIAYKRDLDDLRESPALTIIHLLEDAGADVSYNDPYFPEAGAGRKYSLRRHSTPLDQAGSFDCLILATDHTAYDYPSLVATSQLFIDTRNATRGIVSSKIVRC
jgi:UDP-N-acetyl-D-glucosamine dehydrogenase